MTEATRRRDALLDAIAYANAVYRGDQEAWEAILDANWSYPQRLQDLFYAQAWLTLATIECDRHCTDVDEALATVRQHVLERYG